MQTSHKKVQLALKKALTPHEVWLEKNFPVIGRIADVVWPAQKLIFEVQCSSISVQEIEARCRDYEKIGFSVIWILHDCCFNRPYLSPAERFLRTKPHYFTNINAMGHGEIYDQYAFIRWGQRIKRTPRYPISPSQLILLKQIPRHLPKERRKWKLSFGGDLFHQEIPINMPRFRLYRFLFQLLLEKTCN